MKKTLSSVRLRLLLSFALVSSFAVIVALTASYSFNEVGKSLDLISSQRMPAVISAGEMARSVENIVSAAPRLLNSRDEEEKKRVRQQLDNDLESLNRLLSTLKSKLNTEELEVISPAVTTLRNNLNRLDAVIGKTFELEHEKGELLEKLEKSYISFERTLAPRLLRANARLKQLLNATGRNQPIDVNELVEVTSRLQPLQQLQKEVQTLRDGLLKIAYEADQNSLELLSFPLQRSQNRAYLLLDELSDETDAALKPELEAILEFVSADMSIMSQRLFELKMLESGNLVAQENKMLSQQLTNAVEQLVNSALVDIHSANNAAQKLQRDSQIFMLGVVGLAVLCSILIVVFYIDHRIVRRLRSLGDNMSSIAGGNLQGEIIDSAYDEISQMARALEVFRKTAIEVEQYNIREIYEARIQLNNAIESISEGFCLFDKDDRLLLQNSKYRNLFGLEETHIGDSFESLLNRALSSRIESGENRDKYFKERLEHHRNPDGPFIQQLQDGTWLRINERKTENHGTVAIYSDITEIIQHEQVLGEAIRERDLSLGNLEAVMDAIDYGILFLDKDLKVSSINRAFQQIWGLGIDDITNAKNYRDIFSLDFGDNVDYADGDNWDKYVKKRIAEVKKGSISRHEIRTQNGKFILHQCVALADDSRMLAYYDITPLKRVEADLRQSQERYALALIGANEALWEWETNNTEIYVSQRFHEIANLPADQKGLSGDKWLSLAHPDDREQIKETLISHVKGENDYFDIEYRLLGPDKAYRWVQHRGAGLRDKNGWVYRMAGSVGDIEDRKRLEFTLREAKDIAEQNSLFKSQFIANMSHELRTPLNAIIGITEMLCEDVAEEGPEAFAEPLTRVSRAGTHLLSLINDVLDLSRIEADKLDLFPEHFEIEPLLNDVVIAVQHLIQQNNNELHLEVTEKVKFIFSDPLRFRQIVLNLLTNASKFTQNGDIHLRASCETTKNGEWLDLVVSDTGIGIEDDFLDKLFVEFAQEDSSTTRKFGGSGLGLTISQKLCNMMGGEISVKSTVGVGTTFIVRLPAIPSRYSDSEMLVMQERRR